MNPTERILENDTKNLKVSDQKIRLKIQLKDSTRDSKMAVENLKISFILEIYCQKHCNKNTAFPLFL